MKYGVDHALFILSPGSQWNLTGDQYSGLTWISGTKPSGAEVGAKILELDNAEAMKLLRVERDKRLAACDWVSAKATDTGVAVTTAWKTYRQALRDMTTQTPKLDTRYELDLTSVNWPTQPS